MYSHSLTHLPVSRDQIQPPSYAVSHFRHLAELFSVYSPSAQPSTHWNDAFMYGGGHASTHFLLVISCRTGYFGAIFSASTQCA